MLVTEMDDDQVSLTDEHVTPYTEAFTLARS